MTVISARKDPTAMTLTIYAEFEASVERVWQLWQDPRQLERWWGPPTYPATFVDHDLRVEGMMSYFMTGPEGDQPRGWWRVLSIDAPRGLEFLNGFADDNGDPNPDMPTMILRVRIDELSSGRTGMTVETTFPTPQAMEQIMSMGMEEGMTEALSQIDAILVVGVTPPLKNAG
jgi:uncharacterized protein YndB with AHSA1/START domain